MQLSKEARGVLQASRGKIEALEMDKINAGAQQFVASLNRAVEDANIPGLSRQIRGILNQTDRKLAAVDAKKINADIERLLTSLDRAVADANVPAVSGQVQSLMAELRTTNKYLQTLFAPGGRSHADGAGGGGPAQPNPDELQRPDFHRTARH